MPKTLLPNINITTKNDDIIDLDDKITKTTYTNYMKLCFSVFQFCMLLHSILCLLLLLTTTTYNHNVICSRKSC